MGELFAVLSGKGGTGKTSVCAGIATALAEQGKKVLCIDCDVGLRNLDIALGISQIKTSTGLSFALYAEKYTEPALAIEYNNGKCYGMLDLGRATNTINIIHNNEIYHLID